MVTCCMFKKKCWMFSHGIYYTMLDSKLSVSDVLPSINFTNCYLFAKKETFGQSTAWFFGLIFWAPKPVYHIQKCPKYVTAPTPPNKIVRFETIYEYKFVCSPPQTKLNLMSKQNKFDSKMFGSKNQELCKIKLWPLSYFQSLF